MPCPQPNLDPSMTAVTPDGEAPTLLSTHGPLLFVSNAPEQIQIPTGVRGGKSLEGTARTQ
jgi:hypothetical protein